MDGSGVWDTSVFGMKGSEDLGGGMKANFQLESGLQAANGTNGANGGSLGLFNRAATVGLSGAFGSVNVGEQLNPLVLENVLAVGNGFNVSYIVPMLLLTGNVGAGIQGSAGQGAGFFDRNAINYTTPNINGFQATLFGTVESNSQGQAAVTASYTSGPFRFGGAYLQSQANAVSALGPSNYTGSVIDAKYNGGKWDLGIAVNHTDWKAGSTFGGASGTSYTSVSLTGSYAITGQLSLIGAYARANQCLLATDSGNCTVSEIAATYAFSKSTKLYALVQNTKNAGTPLEGGYNSAFAPSAPAGTAFGIGLTKGF
jgi:predicted porin